MPFIQRLLLSVPTIPLAIILILCAVTLSVVGLWIVRRFVPPQLLKMHNKLADSIFQALAMAYTVLLAFVVVVSWQNFDKAKSHTETEANCLIDLYRGSAAFSQPFKDKMCTLVKDYARVGVGEEWKMLARGRESINASTTLRKIWALYEDYEPKTEKEKLFFAESIRKLDDLREARRLRILDSRTGIHPALWFILIAGGIATIGFTFLFGSDSFKTHAVMASILASVIALILLTILSFSYPFTGDVIIGPETFQQIINF